jgi:hypothetical protein
MPPKKKKGGFNYSKTYWQDYNKVKSYDGWVKAMTTAFKNLEEEARSSGQNFSHLDVIEQDRQKLTGGLEHEGIFLKHVQESFSKKKVPTFEEWQKTMLLDDPAEAAEYLNRLLTHSCPTKEDADDRTWKMPYHQYNYKTKLTKSTRGYMPLGTTNPPGNLPNLVKNSTSVAPSIASEHGGLEHPYVDHRLVDVYQEWSNSDTDTWSVFGWYRKFQIDPWNPKIMTVNSGDNPTRREPKLMYNKTHFTQLDVMWQLAHWCILYDKGGNYNEHAAKWALSPGRSPRSVYQDVYDKNHYTKSGDLRRGFMKMTEEDGETKSRYVEDTKDQYHFSTYDLMPFPFYVLWDSGEGFRTFDRDNKKISEYGFTEQTTLGVHLLGTYQRPPSNNPHSVLFPDSMPLNPTEAAFKELMLKNAPDASAEDLKATRMKLLRGFIIILTLSNDAFPGNMHRDNFVKSTRHTQHATARATKIEAKVLLAELKQWLLRYEDLLGDSESKLSEPWHSLTIQPTNDTVEGYNQALGLALDSIYEDDDVAMMLNEETLVKAKKKDEEGYKKGEKDKKVKNWLDDFEARFDSISSNTQTKPMDNPFKAVVNKWDDLSIFETMSANKNGTDEQSTEQQYLSLKGVEGRFESLEYTKLVEISKGLPTSQMTVYEYLLSPYNCSYLPYAETYSTLSSSESLSPVCKRCTRPFFETKYTYGVHAKIADKGKWINVLKPGMTTRGSNFKQGDLACGMPFNAKMEEMRESNQLEVWAYDEANNMYVTEEGVEFEVKGPENLYKPEYLYKHWDPTQKKDLLFTQYRNAHHPDADANFKTVKDCFVGSIDQGFIRTSDFSLRKDGEGNIDTVTYNRARLHYGFCKNLFLERINDSSNLCLDCHNQLGGDGRKGMNLITKPYSHRKAVNPRLKFSEGDGNPNWFTSITTSRYQGEARPEIVLAGTEELPEKDLEDGEVSDCDEVEADGPQVTDINYYEGLNCLDENGLLDRMDWVETELFHKNRINAADKVKFDQYVYELLQDIPTTTEENPAVDPTSGQPDLGPCVVPGGFFFRTNMPHVPLDDEERIQMFKEARLSHQAQADMDHATLRDFNEAMTQLHSSGNATPDQVQQLMGKFNSIRGLLRNYQDTLNIERQTVGERVGLDGYSNFFDSKAQRIEISNNGEYPGPLLGRTVRGSPKMKQMLLHQIRALAVSDEVVGGKRVYTVPQSPSVDIRVFFEAPPHTDGVHFVGMIDYDDNLNKQGERPQTRQIRTMKMTHLFITYVIHRRGTQRDHSREVMRRMRAAMMRMFGSSAILSEMVRFGMRVVQDNDGNWDVVEIAQAKKATNVDNHPESYPNDQWLSHMDHFGSDGGLELAPFTRFFHFHLALKLVHWSKLMFDYFRMNEWLEQAFKGRLGAEFELRDLDGSLLYKDTERPHVDIKLLPQDDWDQILRDYRHKDFEDAQTRQHMHGGLDQILPRGDDSLRHFGSNLTTNNHATANTTSSLPSMTPGRNQDESGPSGA